MSFKVSSIIIAVGASSLLLAGNASAQAPALSYDYVEGTISQGEMQNFDYTNYGAAVSFSLGNTLFLKGTIADGESDDKIFTGTSFRKVDLRAYTVGLGAHLPINARTDFVTEAKYIKNEIGVGGFNRDGEGYGVDAGIRSMISDSVELAAGVNYVDGDDIDGEFGFSADARFYFSQRLSLSVGYAENDYADGITAGLRFNF